MTAHSRSTSTRGGARPVRGGAIVTKTEGQGTWLTGSCGHQWWAPDGTAAVGTWTKDVGRVCPECKDRVSVTQGRPERRCACGAILSVYNRDQTRCGPCLRSDGG